MRGGGRGGKQYLEQLQAFAARHGRAPTAGECGAGTGCRTRVKTLPSYSTFQKHFGTFAAALRAAGLTPRKHGTRIARTNWRKPALPPPRCPKPIYDPHWPVILKEAREALARRCA
jgi:hypothetical protein